jgi:membrane-associated phospholipid phosphatase
MTAIAHRLRARRRPIVRGWPDLAPLITGVVVFAVAASLVHRHRVAGAETDVFRAINDHTVVPLFIAWPIMQLGNFLVIPVAAVAALAARRLRLAVSLLVGGIAAYLIAADVVRRLVVRGRPASLLDDVHLRGAPARGLGFVSGHVAVVTALAVIAWPYLGRKWRAVAVAAAMLVALARVYVGAHFPLDVLGGAGLGLAVAGAVRLAFGRPAANLPSRRAQTSATDPATNADLRKSEP